MAKLPADERELWRRAMRDVAPLPGRPEYPHPGPLPHAGEGTRLHPPPLAGEEGVGVKARAPAPLPPLDRFAGVDRATAERLKRGRYPVAARLDLHGFTQDEAHHALSRAVAAARSAGQRCLLVITGHGRLSGGVLKASVPRWLDEPALRHHVLAIAPAQPPDGGSGALYVLLRRPAARS